MPVELSTTKIEVVPATKEQESILDNLLQLYAHDFREFHNVPLDENGRFHYKNLPLYWSDPQRQAFLVKVDDKVAGFVFVKEGSEVSGNKEVWDVTEFFIMREFRRRGVGMRAAQEIWKQFPGPWEVRVMEANHAAVEFWKKAIATLGGESRVNSFVKDGESWRIFSFNSTE